MPENGARSVLWSVCTFHVYFRATIFVDLVIWQFHGQSSADLLVQDMSHGYRPKSSHTSHCYRPTSSCIRHCCRPSWTHIAAVTDPVQLQDVLLQISSRQELLIQPQFKLHGSLSRTQYNYKSYCYRPRSSYKNPPLHTRSKTETTVTDLVQVTDWSKLQGLFYDILPWRKMLESDARNVKLIQTIGEFRPW